MHIHWKSSGTEYCADIHTLKCAVVIQFNSNSSLECVWGELYVRRGGMIPDPVPPANVH